MRLFVALAVCVISFACSRAGDGASSPERSTVGARFVLAPRAPATPQPAERALSAAWTALTEDDPVRELPVQFALESRPTRLLQPGWTMSAVARSPGTGGKLALEYGVLEKRDGAATAALELRARLEGGREVQQRIELDFAPRWHSLLVDLGAANGEAVELTLSIAEPLQGYVLVGLPAPRMHVPQAAPRTVLLITSDTHRGDHVEGLPRAVAIETPALREIGARGVTFTDCWSTINITVPSHVAILAGLHPRDSGITDNQTMFASEPVVLAELFRDAGWHTFATTSLNLLTPGHSGLGQGFERMIAPQATRASNKTVDAALRLLDEARDRSVFAWVHVFDAHGPYEPPPPYDTRFYPAGRDPRSPAIEPEPGMRVPPNLPGVRDAEYIRALYRGEIANQEQQLLRLLEHPRVKQGIVALTGDHGEVLGRHGIWWAHKDVYPDTLHVPLALAWPGAPAGTRFDGPVQNSDLGRTLLDLAGLERAQFPGRNLARLERVETPRFALSGARTAASVTADGWHFVLQLALSDEPEQKTHRELHQFELFRLRDDQDCDVDLALLEPLKASELHSQLAQWLAGWKGERFAAFKRTDAATVANLAQLGYASNTEAVDASAALFDSKCGCLWCQRVR
ncbi:MAG: sulfatase [Planctomycetes bacterium]|nr:sulfatase [Planctomycetota bacterium]